MRTLENTVKIRTESEQEAKEVIEQLKVDANAKSFYVKKAGYEYKTKKAKGEVIDQAWVVTATIIQGALWDLE